MPLTPLAGSTLQPLMTRAGPPKSGFTIRGRKTFCLTVALDDESPLALAVISRISWRLPLALPSLKSCPSRHCRVKPISTACSSIRVVSLIELVAGLGSVAGSQAADQLSASSRAWLDPVALSIA